MPRSTGVRVRTGEDREVLKQLFIFTGPAALLIACGVGVASAQTAHRPMTVPDIIEMTTFGSQPSGSLPRDIDIVSPDGLLHAVVIKRGNLAHNINAFSLLIFQSRSLFATPTPDTVLVITSSSNRPAISHLKWLSDNHTLAFLGERPGELPQVYTIDVRTRQLSTHTHHATEITGYDIAPLNGEIVYAAKPAVDTSSYESMRQHGFVVRPTQYLGDLLEGAWSDTVPTWIRPDLLFVQHAHGAVEQLTGVPGPRYRSCDSRSLSIAPNGAMALIRCDLRDVPAAWQEYTEPSLAKWYAEGYANRQFALFDLDRRTVEPLLDTPALGSESFQWAPNGESLVIANAFLPLYVTDSAERHMRSAKPAIAEVDVRSHRLRVIAHRDSLDIVAWDGQSGTVELVPGKYGVPLGGARIRYRKTASGWNEVRGGQATSRPVLVVEQGLNVPPRLVAVDSGSERRALALDPNPQLAQLRLGREEIVRWRTRVGDEVVGGFYHPPDFVRGRRYPLVIQTHGFDSTAFWPDGMSPTASAAQPLAGHGMLVLQLAASDFENVEDLMTPREAPHQMEVIEGAIRHLDSLGLIDPSRVGLVGFSRTCFHVLYTLTHSHYPIAAAAVTDGVDFSYLQYIEARNAQVGAGWPDEYVGVIGGPPFGKTLDLWRERAPGFNLDRVRAPVRLEAIGIRSVLSEWEPYAGLLLQHKPVELFVIPKGSHVLVRPADRLASSQGNVDWFRFWLKGEEDPDPAKAKQYIRWRELRKLQHQQPAADTAAVH